MRRNVLALAAAGLLAVASAPLSGPAMAAPADSAVRAVLTNYADIAEAMYADSLAKAKELQAAVQALIDAPSTASLQAARRAWLASRVPYQKTEAYRFGNAIVDEWEGRVNAWPLDEGLIDYVDASYGTDSDENPLYTANVIANTTITHGGEEIDASTITKELLAEKLQEIGGVEANVATGYHAIEFLLWGQDLNGTGPGAGDRPHTDFDAANCTGGNCERRVAYLKAASELLVTDLQEMVEAWGADGAARFVNGVLGALSDHPETTEAILNDAAYAPPSSTPDSPADGPAEGDAEGSADDDTPAETDDPNDASE